MNTGCFRWIKNNIMRPQLIFIVVSKENYLRFHNICKSMKKTHLVTPVECRLAIYSFHRKYLSLLLINYMARMLLFRVLEETGNAEASLSQTLSTLSCSL